MTEGVIFPAAGQTGNHSHAHTLPGNKKQPKRRAMLFMGECRGMILSDHEFVHDVQGVIGMMLKHKRTCRETGQGSTKQTHHQQGSPQRCSCKAVYLTQEEHVLQDEHYRFPVCAKWQPQDQSICGMHREGQLLKLKAKHA